MREFYPELQPYNRGRLRVSDLHEIYYEECGNPLGKPVVILHGGPGGGITPSLRRLHNPKLYRIVLFDQRGCGQSTPNAELRENTTWHLVADMEELRQHLGIETWQVLGGSWGSTLALAYTQKYNAKVTELIVRGIFTIRKREIDWFYQEGANMLFPDVWEAYLAPIPANEHNDLVAAYHKRLTGNDAAKQLACARAWSQWEASTLSLRPDAKLISEFGDDTFALAFARIECHYFVNRGFFESDDQLLAGTAKLRELPGVIIQGRYDVVTPMETAWALHKAWPEAHFEIIPDAGHMATEPGITDALIRATDRFAMRAAHS
jgi:proline iminopeptidase